MKKLFFDMDGVLVNFQSGVDKMSPEVRAKYEGREDEIPGVFGEMVPMEGAVEAVKELSRYYDCHILSTSPWGNPTAMSDKHQWIRRYFDHTVPEKELKPGKTDCGNPFYKKLVLTHSKGLLNDGESFLIDDRDLHGAADFAERHIRFGTEPFLDWNAVVDYLLPAR